MLKFFRKIRQVLVKQGKTREYTKYAIGEMILVIAGILIAVQLNDLNEKRKIGNEMTEKVKALMVNLEDEIRVSGVFNHPPKIRNIQRLLDGELTFDSLLIHPDYLDLENLRIKDDVLEENVEILIAAEDRIPPRYKSIISMLKSLKFHFSIYKQSISEFYDLKRNIDSYIESNYDWYSYDDSVSNAKRLQVYATDPMFRNRLFSLMKNYRRTYGYYSSTITVKLQILSEIKLRDDNYTAEDFRNYYASFTFGNNERFFNEGKKLSALRNRQTEEMYYPVT